jgi:signal transduction histidine kinase
MNQDRARAPGADDRGKFAAIERMAGGVAHKINNKLTPICAYSDLLLSEMQAGNPHREWVQEIAKAGEELTALTQRLQKLALTSKERVPVALNSAVRSRLDQLQPALGADIRLQVELDERAGLVTGEAGDIESIVEELVRNARQAMPQGGTIRVRTTKLADGAEAPGRFSVLCIHDGGRGIAAETRAHLFEPYFTTWKSERPRLEAGGRDKHDGLGLALVHAAATRAGGFVRFESEPGAGTEFRVFFPCAD